MSEYRWYTLPVEGAQLFTTVVLPDGAEKCPAVIRRSPYVDRFENMSEAETEEACRAEAALWTEHGYAVVSQHCRGRGKSSGECIPYIHEREDGLALQEWIRTQPFYNGELFLTGASYTTTVHYVTAPFADDIRGAVFEVQDPERYNIKYRSGMFKSGLHGNWYVGMYKHKQMIGKNYTPDTYRMLPLSAFARTVFGEDAPDFSGALAHPDRSDPFWLSRFGGGEARGACRDAHFPILFVTSMYDIYTGGVFDMWNGLSPETKAQASLLVTPYDHSKKPGKQPVHFPDGDITEAFPQYMLRFCDSVRGRCARPFAAGKVTYYSLFENVWKTDDFADGAHKETWTLGEGEISYTYNPYNPAAFKGGLSVSFGGNAWQDPPNSRYDIKSILFPPFTHDRRIKGKMHARLTVRSDCEDTCFYLRLSLEKPEGFYGVRDDIRQISNFTDNYIPGEEIGLTFTFDEICILVKEGERLRLDISSSCFPQFVPHTNVKGLFSEVRQAKIARNTVVLDKSNVTICFDEE